MMFAAPNWFLYAEYTPPDRTRFCSVLAIGRAIAMSRRTVATRFAQHGRIGKWFRERSLEKQYQPN